MKPSFTKILLSASTLLLCSGYANAAIYTAAVSGNFSSAATWGGSAPTAIIGANSIIIPSGITVTMDVNVSINSSFSTFQLFGTGRLVGSGSNYLAITEGQVTADLLCNITVDSLYINADADLGGYGGSIIAKRAQLNTGATLSSGVRMQATEKLCLSNIANIISPPPVNIDANAVFELGVAGGTKPWLVMKGSSLNISLMSSTTFNPYNLRYESGNYQVGNGFECPNDSLGDIEIALGASQAIALGSDLEVYNKLSVLSGILSIDNYVLTLENDATIDVQGSLSGNFVSDIIINASAANIGTMRFANGTALRSIVLDATPTSALDFESDLIIDSALVLSAGVINVHDNTLQVRSGTGKTVGGGANSYIITEASGRLRQEVKQDSTKIYHVGTVNGYAPISIKSIGQTLPEFTINVIPGVLKNGTSGADWATTQPIVNATWTTSHTGSQTNINYDAHPMWSAAMEVNGYDRSKAYVTKYTSTMWEPGTPAAAMAHGGMYGSTKTGINAFGQIAVFDANTVGITDVVTGQTINVYPNPAFSTLYFSLQNTGDVQATVYSTTGQVVANSTLNGSNNTLSVAQLPAGMYYVQLTGNGVNGTAKFVKQ